MPFRPQFYKDLNKRSNDLLTKDFPSEKRENKVDWKGETASNVSFETSLTRKIDGSVLGIFTPKYRVRDWNTTLTAELKTNRDFKAEVEINDHFTPGLKSTVTGESRGEDLVGTLGFEYRHDKATLTGSVYYGQTAGSTIKASTVVGSQGFQLGTSLDYFVGSSSDSTLKEFNATATYGTDEFDLGFFGKVHPERDSTVLGAFYFQRVNTDLSVGAEVTFDTQNLDTKPKLTAAAQYRVDADATVKTKLDTNGRLGLSWQQKFKSSRLTLSGTVDTNNLAKDNGSNIGFNLSLF